MKKSRLSVKWNKKILCITVVSALLISSLIAMAVYNYKSIKSAENDFLPAEISNAVQENTNASTEEWDENKESVPEPKNLTWTKVEDTNGNIINYKATKEVRILNADKTDENNTDAYIRVCMIPRWINIAVDESASGVITETDVITAANADAYTPFGSLTDIKITDNTYKMGDVTFTLADNWSENWIYNPKDGYFYYKKIVSPGNTTEVLLESVSIEKEAYEKIDSGVSLRVDVISDSIQTGGDAVNTRWKDSGIIINDSDKTLEIETTEAGTG